MKVLVTGIKGQLGFDICNELAKRGIEHQGIDRDECDITNKQAVFDYIYNYAPDVVVHCAAYTAVDRAESEEHICRRVNRDGTEYIALACLMPLI